MDYPELHFPESVDNTMLTTFDSCPQKFFQEFILRKVPIGRSIHLHAGGCMASAFEDIRNKFYTEGASLDDCFEYAFGRYMINWGDFQAPEKQYKDFVNCWCAVEAYFREYPMESDYFQPYMKADGTPATEFKFAIPLDGINHPDTGNPLLYSGRTDLLASPTDTPNIAYVVDEKTTNSLGASWQYQWDMRGQFHGYTWAAQKSGFPVVGALVRGIAIQQTQFGFQEKPLILNDWQINRWYIEAQKKILRMIRMYELAKFFVAAGEQKDLDFDEVMDRMHQSFDRSFGEACGSYGGCQFKDLCTHPTPWRVYESYEERIWDPLAKDPTSKSEDRLSQMGHISFKDFMGV